MHSFGEAKGLKLTTDAQFARFIDPGIAGADRNFAIKLLEFMPPGMRGDFIYVKGPGDLISNRIALESMVHFFKPQLLPGRSPTAQARHSEALSNNSVRPMSYPPTSCSGGPCLRYYSYQGVNAAYGYASLPCDSVYNDGDNGNMYFNAYDPNGSDVIDAGITQGNSGYSAQNEYAFVKLSSGYVYYGWTNESQLWQCGIPPVGYALGIMYGTLPASLSNGSQNLSFLAVGIPDFDPTQMQMPPSQATWNHSAWTFFNTPPQLLGSAGSWDGIPSPCMFCSVGRMITIAQNPGTPLNDGSCFGACQGVPAARWDEVVMGEIVSPCGNNNTTPPSATCTIETPSNGVWQNGAYNTCNGGIYYSEYNQQDALEGINTNYTTCSSGTSSQSAFSSPLSNAPSSPCTADSYGYCAIEVSLTQGKCGSVSTGFEGYTQSESWEIFKQEAMLELQETATVRNQLTNTKFCEYTTTWNPANPRTTYNDPYLP